ncbi:MAG: hypothetical protein PHR25_02675 [Clostridia bacterium]|nr:hypothetical protein [Clostridia bacterium]MDD4375664.1 hypothetical protein [Clostridia bacterium]
MQEVIALAGYVNKTDYIINLAKAINYMNKSVLVVDGTLEKRLKYTIPSLNENDKNEGYVTQYDSIDFAVGFNSMHDIENYICKRELNIGLYDYILIDIDNSEAFENMRARGINKMYFFVEYSNISIARNIELLKTLMIYKPIDKKLELTKVLFRHYTTRTSQEYYENKLMNFAIEWNENSFVLTYDDQDRIADIEAQQSGIIDIMRHTKQFVTLIAEMGADILKDVTSSELRKEIKQSSRRGR